MSISRPFAAPRSSTRRDFLRVFLPVSAVVAAATLCAALLLSALFMSRSTLVLRERELERLRTAMGQFARFSMGSIPALIAVMEEEPVRDYLYAGERSLEKALAALARIDAALVGNDFIDSIYLYNQDSGTLSTRAGWEAGRVPSDADLGNFVARAADGGLYRLTTRRLLLQGAAEKTNLFSFVFAGRPAEGAAIRRAFVVNLSEARIRSALAAGNLYVVDAERNFLSHPDPDYFGSSVGAERLIVRAASASAPWGMETVRDGAGRSYLVTWADYAELGWRFFSVAPEREVLAPVLKARDGVVALSLAVLAAALAAAYVLSQRVAARSRRAETVGAFLRGELEPMEAGATPARLFPGLRFPCSALLVRCDSAHAGSAAAAVLGAAFGEGVFRVADDAFLVVSPLDPAQAAAAFSKAASSAAQREGLVLGAAAWSSPLPFAELPSAAAALLETRRSDYLRPAGAFLEVGGAASDAAEGEPRTAADRGMACDLDFLPLEKAFRLDDEAEAARRVDDLVAELRAASDGDLFRYACAALSRRIVASFGPEAEALLPGGADAFRESLSQARRLDELESGLRTAASRLKLRGGLHAERRGRDLADRVKRIVEDRIADRSLGTAAIAAEVGLSPSYLRDLFKRVEGVSLLDYVGTRRLETAKALLLSTSAPVREICDRSGFINYSYFFTYFKKAVGTTPSEFRDRNGA